MKKIFIYSFLFILTTFVYPDSEFMKNYMKNWTKEDIAKFNKMSQVEKKSVIKFLKHKEELKKAKELNKTLDKLNNMLDVKN